MNESFFGKNGTLNQVLNVASDIKSMQSDNAVQRAQGIKDLGSSLYALVKLVGSLFV